MISIRLPVFGGLLLGIIFSVHVGAVDINFPIPDSALGPDFFGNQYSLYPGFNTNFSNNTVNVNGGVVPNSVYGGMAGQSQTVSNNQVTIYGGAVGSGPFVVGALTRPIGVGALDVKVGAGVTASVGGAVYGGLSWFGDVLNNTVTIAGGTVDGHIRGGAGLSGSGLISGNRVVVTGGSVGGEIDGGLAIGGDSVENSVSISGGNINNVVWGGSSINGGKSTGNSVTMTGGVFQRGVIGGYATTGDITECNVTVSGMTSAQSFPTGIIELYGAYSPQTGAVTSNTVTIVNSSGVRSGGIIGGFTAGGPYAIGNEVSISNSPGFASIRVLGGHANGVGAVASSNTVSISDSAGFQVGIDIAGGSAPLGGGATDNSVTIADSSGFQAGNIVGGTAYGASGGQVIRNIVTLSNSPNAVLTGAIHGGQANSSIANNNIVTISSMQGLRVAGDIVGGSTVSGAMAIENSITISNASGLQAGNIIGGNAPGGTRATDNMISFENVPGFSVGTILGGVSGGDFFSNNSLTMNRSGGTAEGVLNFQNYSFQLPNTLGNGQTLIAITGPTPTEMGNTTLTVTEIEGGGHILLPGNSVVLIGKATGTPAVANVTNVPKGVALLYDFTATTADGTLRLKLADAERNPASDVLPTGRAAAIIAINHYAELIDGLAATRILEPQERRRGPGVYARVLGGTYRSGSDSTIDIDGASLLAGLDWRLGDNVVLGGFFETGYGKYDSKHYFDLLPDASGSGRINYYGGGLLAFFKLPANFYAEASVRAGAVDSDYHSDGGLPHLLRKVEFDLSHAYYGAHAGLGYLWRFGEKSALDLYSKYLWVRQDSDSATILGDTVDFSPSDSQRWRTGARFSWAATRHLTPFVGAAFEYEFDGKVDAGVHWFTVRSPELKGGSGIGELGLAYNTDRGLGLELSVRGYAGKREGVIGRFVIGQSF